MLRDIRLCTYDLLLLGYVRVKPPSWRVKTLAWNWDSAGRDPASPEHRPDRPQDGETVEAVTSGTFLI